MRIERIATVKKTGSRYIVQQLDFRTGKCYCWGELMGFDTKKGSKHESSLSFPIEQVSIQNDVVVDLKLYDELFEQSKRAHAADIESGALVQTGHKRGPR